MEDEVERKGILPESQGRFRTGRGTIDNIFILDHLVQRENKEKDKKIFAAFIDLKAAFDNVDREKLWRVMEEKEISKGLIGRWKKLYEGTNMRIRTNKGRTGKLETAKGVRQGCVLSPLLFSLYVADVDRYMEKRGIRGIKLGRDRIWSLAYADIVIVAKNRVALLDMLGTFRRFLKERGLILNAGKTKMVFNKNEKEKAEKWIWGGEKLEEVKAFKYLGFTFNRKGDVKDHIKALSTKAKLAANKVWSIGERICKDDFIRRGNLFAYLVRSVMEYGVEIWG